MSPLAIALVLLSAFLHAGWNLLSKHRNSSASFFLVASLAGALLLSPSLVLYSGTLLQISPHLRILLLITGLFQALYYTALAGAYRAGDISIAYPISRSVPVILVFIVTMILGRGEQISRLLAAGIFLVVSGCFLIPLRRFTDFHLKNYLNPTCGLALLAAAGVAGYSVIDDEALHQLRTDTDMMIGNTRLTILYTCLEALASALWLFLFAVLRRKGRSDLGRVLRNNIVHAAVAGVVIHLTYLIVLVSLAFASNVTYVVAFRQISIPLGAMLGILVLKETPYPPKLAGVGIMCIGLMMVAVG